MAMLLQTLSAKLGIASGTNLAEHCRNQFPPAVVWFMWGVMEVVLRGEPSEIIVKTARHVVPNLIVLGIHSEKGLAAFLSNSAVSKVASSTPLPLLLVRE